MKTTLSALKSTVVVLLVALFFIGCYYLGNYSVCGADGFHQSYLMQFFGMIVGFFIVSIVCIFILIGYGLYKLIISNI